VLAEVEARRAHEIADVLDEEHVELADGQLVQGVVHHRRIEMASVAGRDLHGGHAAVTDALGVVLGREIALDDAQPQCVAQCPDRRLEQRSLAGPG